ncbi:Oxidoreductase molybdopterin binding domain-containing protein [Friedmanniella luteola]|uniref:Oxidoreductase molybdopterin binding domain-containing protein n=1 Tax=Friedmanniella luteola TaxID=546871 RepID=A0A1H1RDD1_9ACTN|nr:molybdopterin-dependent oxidoreductase [Friedmanniella luteola]SDS33767.1 Oxidoreductase molybdopterin binding domain-containing protein [Friedmanniella luteola]
MSAVPSGAVRRRAWRPLRRAGRRTNLGLGLLLLGALASGGLLFAAGTPGPATAARVAHGVTGLGVLVLAPWKSVVVLRAARLHSASLALLGLLAVCLASGVVQVLGGYGRVLGVSPVQVHVGSAVGLLGFGVVHVLRHRPVGLSRRDASRRRLLVSGAFGLAAAATWAVAELTDRRISRGAAARIATGSHRLPPAAIPATTWLLDRVPALDRARHRVRVDGVDVTAAALTSRGTPVAARLDCTSGWFADATWTGVPLAALLDPGRVAAARSVVVTSVTGYRRRFPAAEVGALWLATAVEGRPLTAGTGAPVRLVAPGRRGFWWVKWVASVELDDRPAVAQPPFPLQ